MYLADKPHKQPVHKRYTSQSCAFIILCSAVAHSCHWIIITCNSVVGIHSQHMLSHVYSGSTGIHSLHSDS